MPKYIADRKLWLTADRERVVEDGDPEARFLLAVPGRAVPEEQAVRLGLMTVRQVTDRVRADLAEAADAGEKRRRKPVEDKQVAAGEGSEDKSDTPKAESDDESDDDSDDDDDSGDGGGDE